MEKSDSYIQHLLDTMTLDEKASMLSGKDFWSTVPIDRLGISSLTLSDGPHGLRKTASTSDMGAVIIPSTCFPTEAALASSWDRELIREVGQAIADQCLALGVNILLGPGVNMKRTPLGGRNFEYFSEDPILSGELGAAYVQGVQSKGVGACVKHLACNNQEYERMTISSELDERTLRETYLPAFERVIRKAKPWMVMTAYNRINGIYAAENKQLLTDILKNEWGFEGAVISDWGGVSDIVRSIQAGLDLEMPGNGGYSSRTLIKAVRQGRLSEEKLNGSLRRLLKLIGEAGQQAGQLIEPVDEEKQHALARRAAADSIVLLKNDHGILPLEESCLKSLAVIGGLALKPIFQGIGSSQGKPTQLDSAHAAFRERLALTTELHYADGYDQDEEVNEEQIAEAVRVAAASDAAVLFVGVTPVFQKEGRDRKHISLPVSHVRLIEEVCRVQPHTIVILASGSAVAMPWVHLPKAIVAGGLGGQAGGSAIVDVLIGNVNPSGKLAETFPVRLEDTPAYLNYPGEDHRVRYGEGPFIGYRYYDKLNLAPLYPFGHGLSYSEFEYEELHTSHVQMTEADSLEVRVKVRNVSQRSGKEVVQLYVAPLDSARSHPVQQLKDFAKVELEPGECKEITLTVEGSDFAFYDPELQAWRVESGRFEVRVGGSSRRIALREMLTVRETRSFPLRLHPDSPMKAFMQEPSIKPQILQALCQTPLLQVMKGGGQAEEAALLYFGDIPLRRLVSMGVWNEEAYAQFMNQIGLTGQEERSNDDN